MEAVFTMKSSNFGIHNLSGGILRSKPISIQRAVRVMTNRVSHAIEGAFVPAVTNPPISPVSSICIIVKPDAAVIVLVYVVPLST